MPGVSSQAMDQTLTGSENLGTYGLDPEMLADLEKQFGFDKPVHVRFFTMVWNYVRFDFGDSYFQDTAGDRARSRGGCPCPISLGLWSLLSIYGISHAARRRQGGARRHGVRFLDQHGDLRRLRHPRLHPGDPTDHPVRRPGTTSTSSRYAGSLRRISTNSASSARSPTISGISPCR